MVGVPEKIRHASGSPTTADVRHTMHFVSDDDNTHSHKRAIPREHNKYMHVAQQRAHIQHSRYSTRT